MSRSSSYARAGVAVLRADGIAEDGGWLDFHRYGAEVRQQMRKNARTSVLTADRWNFGRAGPAGDLIAGDLPADGPFAPLIGAALIEMAQDRPVRAGDAA
jgi:hypothetical protein